MTTSASGAPQPVQQPAARWPAVLTWRGVDAPRMESVRIQVNGKRIKAAGRIIGGDCAQHQAFSASYDLVTDENGVTRRLSLRTSVAGGERHTSISRDGEGYWLLGEGGSRLRSAFAGALDVDVVLSPFFNALPIRRLDLHTTEGQVEIPVVYVNLPDLSIREVMLTYRRTPDGLEVRSPITGTPVTVRTDPDGFLYDYPSLADRI